jgi:hypothetical protein
MPYAASHTAGTLVKIKISGTYTLIPGLQNFTNDGGEKGEIDTTPLNATAKTSVGGTPDYGTWTGELAWDPGDTVHQALAARYATTPAPTEDFEITMTDVGAATVQFFGYIKRFNPTYDKESFNKSNFAVRQTSALVITP